MSSSVTTPLEHLKPKDFSVDLSQLRSLQPIQTMLPAHIESLMSEMQEHWLFTGDTLFTAGQFDGNHYFLLSGSVQLSFSDGTTQCIQAHDGLLPICDDQPRICTAKALEDCSLVSFNCDRFDQLLTWSQVAEFLLLDIAFDRNLDEDADWMSGLLKSNLFLKVPPTNMGKIYQRIDPLSVESGEVIIRQGEYGDQCYFIKEGCAQVTRRTHEKDEPQLVADIFVGRCFGEDALVYEKVRNASVTMSSDGVLMVLRKNDFIELLKEPKSFSINWPQWRLQMDSNIVIDVRTEAEYQLGHLHKSINIPLHLLRLKSLSLSSDQNYLIYCNTGNRSQAASYLLQEQNISGVALKGGLAAIPATDKVSLWTQQDYIVHNGVVKAGTGELITPN
jgi:CRP-like cAMP-binding protein